MIARFARPTAPFIFIILRSPLRCYIHHQLASGGFNGRHDVPTCKYVRWPTFHLHEKFNERHLALRHKFVSALRRASIYGVMYCQSTAQVIMNAILRREYSYLVLRIVNCNTNDVTPAQNLHFFSDSNPKSKKAPLATRTSYKPPIPPPSFQIIFHFPSHMKPSAQHPQRTTSLAHNIIKCGIPSLCFCFTILLALSL